MKQAERIIIIIIIIIIVIEYRILGFLRFAQL